MQTPLFTITAVAPVVPSTDIQVQWDKVEWPVPVPAGTHLGTVTVMPANWSGVVMTYGPDMTFFSVQGRAIIAANDIVEPRTYSVGFRSEP